MELPSVASQLVPVLEPLQDRIQPMHYRVVPSTTDAEDEALRAVPLPRDWQWSSLERYLRFFKPETVMLQLPAFWQLEPFVHQVLRRGEVPVCIIETSNYPLDTAVIRFASGNTVVAEAAEAEALAQHLQAQHIALPTHWVLVHAVHATQWQMPQSLVHKSILVAQEVHLVPGVPLLVQCEHSIAAKNTAFHLADTFVWNTDSTHPSITTTAALHFAFKNLTLPFELKSEGGCACGKTLYARAG